MDETDKNIASVDKNEQIRSLRLLISESGAGAWDKAWY